MLEDLLRGLTYKFFIVVRDFFLHYGSLLRIDVVDTVLNITLMHIYSGCKYVISCVTIKCLKTFTLLLGRICC